MFFVSLFAVLPHKTPKGTLGVAIAPSIDHLTLPCAYMSPSLFQTRTDTSLSKLTRLTSLFPLPSPPTLLTLSSPWFFNLLFASFAALVLQYGMPGVLA